MSEDAGRRPPKSKLLPRGRRLRIPGSRRDTAVVFALLLAALLSVWLVLTFGRGGDTGEGRAARKGPESVIPPRVPYSEIIRGKVRELPAGREASSDGGTGRVEILYDFEPRPATGAPDAAGADLYPELDDWNWPRRSGVVRGGGRFLGEARSRLAFSGPVEVAAVLELREPGAAILVGTDMTGVGYAAVVYAGGVTKLRLRRLRPTDGSAEAAVRGETLEAKDLAGPARLAEPAANRRLAVRFTKSAESLRLEIDGREVLTAPVPSPDPFPDGNVALLSPKRRSFWDEVRISGTLSRDTIEDRMHVALGLTPRDAAEPDDTWSAARELIVSEPEGGRGGDGPGEARTFKPEGDVDWASVAVPRAKGAPGAALVRVETRELRLGITTELAAFAPDGRTRLEVTQLPVTEPGAAAVLVGARALGGELFYVRLAEPEGRVGSYRLRASLAARPGR